MLFIHCHGTSKESQAQRIFCDGFITIPVQPKPKGTAKLSLVDIDTLPDGTRTKQQREMIQLADELNGFFQ